MVDHRSDCGIDSAVAAAKAQIVETIAQWLEWMCDKDPETLVHHMDLVEAIRSGAPERWAAEREVERRESEIRSIRRYGRIEPEPAPTPREPGG